MLFLHGWGVTRHVWNGFEKQLCDKESLWNPCLYTLAEKSRSASLESLAEDIKNKLGDKTIVVAWSIGGLIAITLSQLSDKIRAIIFIASTPCFINKPGWRYTIAGARLDRLHGLLKSKPQAALRSFSNIIVDGDPAPETTRRRLRNSMAAATRQKILSVWLYDLARLDHREGYAELTVPAYVLLGQNDVLLNNAVKKQLTKLNGNIKVDVINNCGHAPFISRSEETQRLIQEYMRTQING